MIDIVSLGTVLTVPESACDAVQNAELIVGAERHFAALDCGDVECVIYPSPIDKMSALLDDARDKKIVVLASGDALFFGIGSWLLRNCDPQTLRFHANVSSVQTACARIGRAWQSVRWLSLHGRPMHRLRAALLAGKTLAIFTDAKNTPQAIAQELLATGFATSAVHVFEALDSDAENIGHFSVQQLSRLSCEFNPLNLLLVDVRGASQLLPAFPGIDDAVFAANGDSQFTKREVRLAALSRLALGAGETGWDIGAGSGGIAIEWARWTPQAKIFAIECDALRRQSFDSNRERFGDHGNLELVAGEAPAALGNLPEPDAVYVGGSGGSLPAILDFCREKLKPGGRLVVAGVTVETRAILQNYDWQVAVEFSEISVSHAAPLGAQTAMRAQLPVLLATMQKP